MQRERAVGVSFREADREVAFEPRTERRDLLGSGGRSHVTGRRIFAWRVSAECRRISEFRWYHG